MASAAVTVIIAIKQRGCSRQSDIRAPIDDSSVEDAARCTRRHRSLTVAVLKLSRARKQAVFIRPRGGGSVCRAIQSRREDDAGDR